MTFFPNIVPLRRHGPAIRMRSRTSVLRSECGDKTAEVDCTGCASRLRAVITIRRLYSGFSHCEIILKWIREMQWVRVLTAKFEDAPERGCCEHGN